jgi:hypothetical protein
VYSRELSRRQLRMTGFLSSLPPLFWREVTHHHLYATNTFASQHLHRHCSLNYVLSCNSRSGLLCWRISLFCQLDSPPPAVKRCLSGGAPFHRIEHCELGWHTRKLVMRMHSASPKGRWIPARVPDEAAVMLKEVQQLVFKPGACRHKNYHNPHLETLPDVPCTWA